MRSSLFSKRGENSEIGRAWDEGSIQEYREVDLQADLLVRKECKVRIHLEMARIQKKNRGALLSLCQALVRHLEDCEKCWASYLKKALERRKLSQE